MNMVQKQNENTKFYRALCDLAGKKDFLNFDTFIIREMGFEFQTEQELESVRRPAMRMFRNRTRCYPFASLPTIRRWFGIGGYSRPQREQVLQICLMLHTDLEKAEEYLTRGLGESSIIFSDYHEMIWAYGLENHCSLECCEKMIRQFELYMLQETPDCFPYTEEELREEYVLRKSESPSSFFVWMKQNAMAFKGYNDRALACISKAKKLVMKFARREAEERLENFLAETNFKSWQQSRTKEADKLSYRESIKKYIHYCQTDEYYHISPNMCEVILELVKIVYSEVDANTRFLAEVFTASNQNKTGKWESNFLNIKSMTSKHLSDLFNIPIQQSRAMKVRQAFLLLQDKKEDELCPQQICQMWKEYTRASGDNCPKTVMDAKNWLIFFEHEHQRRKIHINRSDILPLAHYVAQHCYLQREESHDKEYDEKRGRQEFQKVADWMLERCHMAALNEAFEMDAVLLACYQPDEMYSFPDVLDVVEGRKC